MGESLSGAVSALVNISDDPIDMSRPAYAAFLVALSTSMGCSAMRRAIPSTVDIRSAADTTWVTRPTRSASSALITSPVRRIGDASTDFEATKLGVLRSYADIAGQRPFQPSCHRITVDCSHGYFVRFHIRGDYVADRASAGDAGCCCLQVHSGAESTFTSAGKDQHLQVGVCVEILICS